MAIRKSKPTSPGRRFATYQDRSEVTAQKPNKKLSKGKGWKDVALVKALSALETASSPAADFTPKVNR